jgi:cytochrome b561
LQLRNSSERWGSVAKAFHWTIVALILLQFWLAQRAEALPLGLAKLGTLARHKSVGLTILALAVLRLAWRWSQRESPPLPGDLKPWERAAAGLTHVGLYALLFALPLTGWAMSSAKNYPVSWFSLFALPDLVAPDERVFEVLVTTHGILAATLVAFAALHVLGALQHHFIRKDSVLLRMLPFGRDRHP